MTYAEFAATYLGTVERTRRHHEIIDYYNAHTSGYNMRYTDPWCAAFVSFVWLNCNAVNPPLECSCARMLEKARKNGQVVKIPMVNDVVVYDWGNNGTYDHVGIISFVGKSSMRVIEGNYKDSVMIRDIKKTAKEITAILRVIQQEDVAYQRVVDDLLIADIIAGKYGNGNARKKKLESLGYDYNEVRTKVNEAMQRYNSL